MTSSSNDETRTTVIQVESEDLRASLSEIISSAHQAEFDALRKMLLELKVAFDPASVTMTSTNIPDASTKLSSALMDSQDAAQRVFHHTEEQKQLLEASEVALAELERAKPSKATLNFIAKQRELNKQLHARAHDIVITQEFQDLAGQKIKKVLKLVLDIDSRLRSLLSLFRIAMPPEQPTGAEEVANEDIDQDAANQILEDFGL